MTMFLEKRFSGSLPRFMMLSKKGFTFVEVVLIVVVLGLVLGFSLLYYQTSQVRADVNAETAVLVSYLRLAQSNAVAGRTGQPIGIHLESSSYTLFSSAVYSESDSFNYEIDLPPTLVIENISLNDAGQDIVFSSSDGGTNNYGSFDITSAQINKTLTVTVSSLGSVTY